MHNTMLLVKYRHTLLFDPVATCSGLEITSRLCSHDDLKWKKWQVAASTGEKKQQREGWGQCGWWLHWSPSWPPFRVENLGIEAKEPEEKEPWGNREEEREKGSGGGKDVEEAGAGIKIDLLRRWWGAACQEKVGARRSPRYCSIKWNGSLPPSH